MTSSDERKVVYVSEDFHFSVFQKKSPRLGNFGGENLGMTALASNNICFRLSGQGSRRTITLKDMSKLFKFVAVAYLMYNGGD